MLLMRSTLGKPKKGPGMFIHELTVRQYRREVTTCSVCGEKNREHLFYCPVCEKYYCFDCGHQTLAGVSCPECRQLTFLKRVRIVS